MSQNSQIITEFDNIPTLPYKEWLREVVAPLYRYKIIKLGKNEIKQSLMTDSERSEYQAFWLFHNSICKTGCFTGGEYISGWLYWHLNYMRIPKDKKGDLGSRDGGHPDFRDNEHLIDYYKLRAQEENKPLIIFGSRRFGKSAYITSELSHGQFIYPNTENSAVFGNEDDMIAVKILFQSFYDNRPDCFSDMKIMGDFFKGTGTFKTCIPLQRGSETEDYSIVKVTNLGMALSKRTEEKLAGGTPFKVIYDETGKYDWLARWKAQEPGLETSFGKFRHIPLFVGTGGEISASKDAEKVFLDAENNGFLVADLSGYKNITKHFMYSQESNISAGLFVPGQMSLKGGEKIVMNLSEYTSRSKTKKEIDELQGLTIQVTNWDKATEVINKHVATQYNISEDVGNKARMYYPFQPEHCFMFKESNPFNTVLALERIKYLEDNNMYGELVELSKVNGKITVAASDKPICKKLPFEGGTIDAPIQIYEHPDFENPSWGSYVAGYDGVRLDVVTSTSNSLISLYVIKMINFSFKIVASYVTRPERMNKAYEQCHLLLEYYNAFCLPERDDQTGFKSYLQAKNRIDLLSKRIYHDKNEQFKFIYKESDYGQPSSDARSKKILTALPIAYCNNDNGEIDDANEIRYEARGIEEIPDIMLLKELVSFKKINMDRYWSWAHALMLGEEIAKNNFLPQNNINEKNDEGRRVIKREIRRSGNRNVRRIR